MPYQYEEASTVMVSRLDGRQDGKVMCAVSGRFMANSGESSCSSSADDAEKTWLQRTQLHYSTHSSSPQVSLAKGGLIEARLRGWMFDTTFQRLQIKTVRAVAPQEG